MDPLSAVSLVGNVVQLLDFGIRLAAKTHEIYHSAEGAQVRNIELDAIAQDLVSLNQRVRNRSRKFCIYAISEDEKALETLTEQCNKVGDELVNALQKAKVQGAHKHWKSVRQALKSVLDENVQGVKLSIIESESRIVAEARQARFRILDAIRRSNYNPCKPEDVATVSELLSDMVSLGSEKKNREDILDSLYYPRMQDR